MAITAVRLHQPAGEDFTLGQYLTVLRGWVEVLKMEATEDQRRLKEALKSYQAPLRIVVTKSSRH